MTDQFVIYLGSSDSQNVHPANSNTVHHRFSHSATIGREMGDGLAGNQS